MANVVNILLLCVPWLIGYSVVGQVEEAPIRHPGCLLTDESKFLPYPNSCTKYYSCQQGFATAISCPNGLRWNALTAKCDYAKEVDCSDGQPVVTPTPTATTIATTSSSQQYFQAHPSDCNRYYICGEMRCPANNHWNNLQQRCDSPQTANCASEQTAPLPAIATTAPPTSANSTPASNENSTPADAPFAERDDPNLNELCKNGGQKYIAYPGDCHNFIQCDLIAYVVKCPSNLYWNSKANTCDKQCI